MVDFTEGQASALGAAAGIGSSLLGGIFSARQAKSQMRFQRDMYKQRYQFQVEDLKKAGLNPMLAYQQAAPAAPVGAMGQMDAPDLVNSAKVALLMREQLKNLEEDTKLKSQQALREGEAANLASQQEETEKNNSDIAANSAKKVQMDVQALEDMNRNLSEAAGYKITLGPEAVKMLLEAGRVGSGALEAVGDLLNLPIKALKEIFGRKPKKSGLTINVGK